VASLAVFECEIAAEGSFAVVTCETRRAARRDEMFCRSGRAYLPRLSGAGSESMTVSTRKSLSAAMICVAECVAIRARVGAGGPVCFAIVTDTA